jgi:hypothetical protein
MRVAPPGLRTGPPSVVLRLGQPLTILTWKAALLDLAVEEPR